MECLLHELPPLDVSALSSSQTSSGNDLFESHMPAHDGDDAEQALLLPSQRTATEDYDAEDEPISIFVGLNALEIAAVANAKKFLSQRSIQGVVVSFPARLTFQYISVEDSERGSGTSALENVFGNIIYVKEC